MAEDEADLATTLLWFCKFQRGLGGNAAKKEKSVRRSQAVVGK